MRESLEASLVRIHTADGHVVGAGFLVGERHILTCAQVVDNALGLADDAPNVGMLIVGVPMMPAMRITAALEL
jgi:hypothetical protein